MFGGIGALRGRDFSQLATLVPGAISRGTNASLDGPAISLNGISCFLIDRETIQ